MVKRHRTSLAFSLLAAILLLGFVAWLHPVYVNLLAGGARVLARDPSVSLSWETPFHPHAEPYRAKSNPEQLVLWVSPSRLSKARIVIFVNTRTWELGVPNSSPAQYARLFPSWLVQAESGVLGASPGKLEWSPRLQVRAGEAAFTLPDFAFNPPPRIVVRPKSAT